MNTHGFKSINSLHSQPDWLLEQSRSFKHVLQTPPLPHECLIGICQSKAIQRLHFPLRLPIWLDHQMKQLNANCFFLFFFLPFSFFASFFLISFLSSFLSVTLFWVRQMEITVLEAELLFLNFFFIMTTFQQLNRFSKYEQRDREPSHSTCLQLS